MSHFKVLRAEASADAYRNAVETIIRDIQRDTGSDLTDIAEAIECSVGTISNAVNKKADLNAVYLLRLGQAYGSGYLNPYLGLVGAQVSPLDGSPLADMLPLIMALAHKMALARDPAGPGGIVEVPQERAGYLPDLKRAVNTGGCLIREIEEQLA